VRIWEAATGKELAGLPLGNTWSALFHSNGRSLFTSGSVGIRQWPLAWQQEGQTSRLQLGPPRTLKSSGCCGPASLDRTGQLLSFVDGDVIRIVDVESGSDKIPTIESEAVSVALSPDGEWCAVARSHLADRVRIWSLQTGEMARELPETTGGSAIAFSPDGKWLATCSTTECRFWGMSSWECVQVVPRGGTAGAARVAFSQDNSMVAVPLIARGVRLLRTGSWEELAELEPPTPQYISDLTFSPDGGQLVAASETKQIHLWDLRSIRQQLAELKLDWDLPPLPSPRHRESARPITVTFLGLTDNPVTNFFTFPPRAAQCSPKHIDLSAAYNATLTNCWFNPAWAGNDLAALPQGLQTLDGIQFDIRGVLQLHGTSDTLVLPYPWGVTNIPVRQRCHALHFLHAVGYQMANGAGVGEYLVHYQDGVTRTVPLVFGENIGWWCRLPHDDDALSQDTRVGWRGQNPWNKREGYDTVLYKFRWSNPRPEVEIQSLDFKSAMNLAAPFLIAITAE